MEHTRKKTRIVFNYIFLSLYVLCTCFILGLSLQDGQKSSDLSGSVGDGLAGIVDGVDDIIHGGGSGGGSSSGGGSGSGESSGGSGTETPSEPEVAPRPSIVDRLKEKGHDFYLIVRKLFGHFGAFVVLGALACVVYLSFISNYKISFPVLIGAGALTAIASELLQLIPEGRCCTLKDMGIDFSGYLLASAVGIGIYIIVNLVKQRKAKKLAQLN